MLVAEERILRMIRVITNLPSQHFAEITVDKNIVIADEDEDIRSNMQRVTSTVVANINQYS